MSKVTKIAVIGAGGWGTALAIAAYRAGSETVLWTRNQNVYDSLLQTRTNEMYLPEIFVDPDIELSTDLSVARGCDFVILAVPAQHMRHVSIQLADLLSSEVPLVVACKGIERGSLSLMHEVLLDTMPKNPVLVLSGPNFASEVAKGLPAATTIACKNEALADQFIYAIGGRYFRPYFTDDLVATQIGSAVKNVIAIACGIAIGNGFGENARAALMTRGLAEMMRLAEAMGGRRESLMGLSGIGDLVLTCSSTQSRNFSYGYRLVHDSDATEVKGLQQKGSLAEGVVTAESVALLSEQHSVPMPLCNAVCRIIQAPEKVTEIIEGLLSRPFVMDVERSGIRKMS